eukprot:TRINITY_DN24533_c0_g2_i12.p1 TRINITY_DN24533_c0_g2~~TRINITY_DN24533_c0_g2_i12.p1  ORF type:complete len:370 (+),score=90.68 TRINITY_DN24533_c0_g2_i12:81-1190(+)
MAVYFYDKNGYWRCEGRRRYEWRQSDRQVREPGQANEDGDWWRLFYVNKLEEKIKMLEEKVDKMNKQLMETSQEDNSWRWWLEWRMQNTEYHYYNKLSEVDDRVGGNFEGMLMKEGGDFELDGVSVEDIEAITKNEPKKFVKKTKDFEAIMENGPKTSVKMAEVDNYDKLDDMMELLNKIVQKNDVEKLMNKIAQKLEHTRRYEDDKAKGRRKRKKKRRQASEDMPDTVDVLESTEDDVDDNSGEDSEGMRKKKKSEETEGTTTCPSHLVVEGGIAAVNDEGFEQTATCPSHLVVEGGIAAVNDEGFEQTATCPSHLVVEGGTDAMAWTSKISSIGRAMGRGRGFSYKAEYEKSQSRERETGADDENDG